MSEESIQIVTADWVFPMSGPPIRGGAVAIDGLFFEAVGPALQLRAKFPKARVTEMPGRTILPGFINAHTHLELTHRQRPPVPGSFVDWLLEMIRLGREESADPQLHAELLKQSVAEGVRQCLACGVTTVCDISSNCALTRSMLTGGPIHVISYGEVVGMSSRRDLLDSKLTAAKNVELESDFLRCGISPHAPYSVEVPGYEKCRLEAWRGGYPLTTHLAESPDETEFLATGGGPLARLWEKLGGLDDRVPRFVGGPIRMVNEARLLEVPRYGNRLGTNYTLLAHVNYCDDDEMLILAEGPTNVVWCPRTHAYFGHPPHRWREMLDLGIRVMIGTDSAASSGDLNILDDLRLARKQNPDLPAIRLFELITLQPSRAEFMVAGTIEDGFPADMVAFKATGDDPLASILDNGLSPAAVWVFGDVVPHG
jgi:cytosine/adenosine deaminase-related metal-dependent hydrolase